MKKVGNYKDMSPYYNIELVDNVGLNIWFSNRERYYIEVDKENPKQRYKYIRFEKGADRHFFNTKQRQIKYVIGNKFILKGDEINPNSEPDEKGEETRDWITTVIHDPENRQLDEDGREQYYRRKISKRYKMGRIH